MSYTNVDNDLITDRNLNSNEFRIFIYLLQNWNEKYGYSFPLREQIQEGTGISLKTINKVLNSLEEKGYITRVKHKTRNGWNNIYYIHKYLVASKKDKVKPKVEEAPSDKKQVEASTNELLVIEKAKVKRELNDNDKEYLNGLNTDILIKAIERANKFKPNGYHIRYITSCYESIEKELQEERRQATEPKTSNNSSDNKKSNTKALTKYHNTFNEHYKNYGEDELEEKLLKMQAKRRGLA